MSDNGKLPAEAIYTSENKRVRAYYRTLINAEDEFNRALVVGEYAATNDQNRVPLKVICEFALSTFCTRVELLDAEGKVEATHAFTMDLLKQLTGPHAEGGWPASCALQIYREVMDQTARVDDLKKTSETGSPVLTQDESQPAAQSESAHT